MSMFSDDKIEQAKCQAFYMAGVIDAKAFIEIRKKEGVGVYRPIFCVVNRDGKWIELLKLITGMGETCHMDKVDSFMWFLEDSEDIFKFCYALEPLLTCKKKHAILMMQFLEADTERKEEEIYNELRRLNPPISNES